MADHASSADDSHSRDPLDRDATTGGSSGKHEPFVPKDVTHGGLPTLGGGPDGATEERAWVGLELSAGRYEVLAVLGQGGMGAVYRARDKRLQRDVVIKVPHADLLLRSGFAQRFAREIRALVELSHPHVCPIFDEDEHAGTPFAVLKYLGGGSLEARRPKDADGRPAPVAVAELEPWLDRVALALDFIHGRGHVHRDIKPSNILFDDSGNVYLSDLGIAKAVADEPQGASQATLTESGALVGTPAYMPHEVLVGQPYGPRSDQYALAVVVYELLTGRRPYDGLTPAAIGILQATTIPAPPHTLAPGLTEGLSRAVLKGLSNVPEERFGACADLVRAVVKARGFRAKAARQGGPPRATLAAPGMPAPQQEAALPEPLPVTTNSIGMKLVLIPAGEFMMGSAELARASGRSGAGAAGVRDEYAYHRVRITRPFYLGVTQVTQEQYERVMGVNPSRVKGDGQRPVEMVSWDDAVEFCRRLSRQEGKEYRLPTEAEWEYACRAGSTSRFCFGDDAVRLAEYAWYDDNSGDTTHPVGQKKPNAWGLYDVHGNVWEWCADWHQSGYYGQSPADDPAGPASGAGRVLRGGSCRDHPGALGSAARRCGAPGDRYRHYGFRVARTA